MSEGQGGSQSNVNRPGGASGAWLQTDKTWGHRDKQLLVHFLNPEILEAERWVCGNGPMNIDNVLAWAQVWNSNAFPDIPKFKFTDSAAKAHIRVKFGGKCRLVKSVPSRLTIFIPSTNLY